MQLICSKNVLIPLFILVLSLMISPVYAGYSFGDQETKNTSIKKKKLKKRGWKNVFRKIKSRIKRFFNPSKTKEKPARKADLYGTIALWSLVFAASLLLINWLVMGLSIWFVFTNFFRILWIGRILSSLFSLLMSIVGIIKDENKGKAIVVLGITSGIVLGYVVYILLSLL